MTPGSPAHLQARRQTPRTQINLSPGVTLITCLICEAVLMNAVAAEVLPWCNTVHSFSPQESVCPGQQDCSAGLPKMGQTQPTEQNEQEIEVKALQEMYKKFVTECPSGVLFLHEFKRFFGVDPTGEVSEYAEGMFRAFDKNGVRWCGIYKGQKH